MLFNKKRHSRHGFTLIEMILYLGILSLLLLVFTDIFTATLNLQSESSAVSALEMDGRYILQRLSYDFRRATAISAPVNYGGSENNLNLVIADQNTIYLTQGNFLQTTIGAQTYNLNSNLTRIENLNFTRIGNTGGKQTIQIKFDLVSLEKDQAGSKSRHFQTSYDIP